MKKLLAIAIVLLVPAWAWGLQFRPGAEGWGTDTRHAYEGTGDPTIYVVDTLSDTSGSVEASANYNGSGVTVYKGSLRECLTDTTYCAAGVGRIVTFEVGGSITLTSKLYVNVPYVRIAGETAPSPGITIRPRLSASGNDYALYLTTTAHLVITHVRFRGIDDYGWVENRDEVGRLISQTDPGLSDHVVIDHCSLSFAGDDPYSINTGDRSAYISFTNSISAYHLRCQGVCTDGEVESKGLSVSNWIDYISIHRNLFHGNYQRNPLVSRHVRYSDIINNIVSGCTIPMNIRGVTSGESYGRGGQIISILGNYVKPGASPSDYFLRLSNYDDTGTADWSQLYLNKNHKAGMDYATELDEQDEQWTVEMVTESTLPYAYIKNLSTDTPPGIRMATENATISGQGYTVWEGNFVQNNLIEKTPTTPLESVGAYPAERDWVDKQAIQELLDGTRTIYYDDPSYDLTDSACAGEDDPFDCCTGSGVGTCGDAVTVAIPSSPHTVDEDSGYTNLELFLHDQADVAEGISSETPDPGPTPTFDYTEYVAAYRFENGSELIDASGNENTLTERGICATDTSTYLEGAASSEFHDDANYDRYNVDLDIPDTNCTLCAAFETDTNNEGFIAGQDLRLWMRVRVSPRLEFGVGDAGGSADLDYQDGEADYALPVNTWHFACMAVTDSTPDDNTVTVLARVYDSDCNLIGTELSDSISYDLENSTSTDFTIGGNSTTAYRWDGHIDAVILDDTAFGAADMLAACQAVRGIGTSASTITDICECTENCENADTGDITVDCSSSSEWTTSGDDKFLAVKITSQQTNSNNPTKSYLNLTTANPASIKLRYESNKQDGSDDWYLVYKLKVGYTWNPETEVWESVNGQRAPAATLATTASAITPNTATFINADGQELDRTGADSHALDTISIKVPTASTGSTIATLTYPVDGDTLNGTDTDFDTSDTDGASGTEIDLTILDWTLGTGVLGDYHRLTGGTITCTSLTLGTNCTISNLKITGSLTGGKTLINVNGLN